MSGISESLERKIQALLDEGSSPSDELKTVLEGNPEAMQVAKELEKLDRVLRAWGPELVGEPDLDPFARRIEQRLEETLPPLAHDPTLPPAFDDDDSWRRPEDEGEVGHSGEYALSALTEHMSTPPAAAATAEPAPAFEAPPPQSKVVRLAERRKTSYWFAAAAVLGLAATGGIFMMQDGASEPMAMSTASEADYSEMEMAEMDPMAPAAQAAPAPAAEMHTEMPAEEAVVATAEPVGAARGVGAGDLARDEDLRGGVGGESEPRRARMARRRSAMSASRIDDVLAEAPGTFSMASKRPTTTSNSTANGDDVVRRTRTRVEACFGAVPARLDVEVWVDGATGRVRDAQLRSPGTTDESECVRRVVRSAVFPEREGVSRFTVHLRYRPGPPR